MIVNLLFLALIVTGVLALVVSLFLLGNKKRVGRLCGMIMIAAAVWGIAYAMQLTTSSLEKIMFWTTVEYLGIAAMPPLWLMFTITFAGKDHWLTTRRKLLLYVVPVITVVLVATNEFHSLYYRTMRVATTAPVPTTEFEAGGWYWVNLAYFYLLLILGAYFMIKKYRQSDFLFRRHNSLILLGALLPSIFNIFYLAGYAPFGLRIDPTPFAFLMSSLFIGFGLIRYQLFDIVPIARDKIIQAMGEGILVSDSLGRIVDVNPAMQHMLSPFAHQLVGLELDALIPKLNLPATDVDLNGRGVVELKVPYKGVDRYFSVTNTPFYENNVLSGRIYVCKETTERKQYEAKLESLNKLKDKLFSIISHDLRTPLINLLDLLSLSNQGMISDEELKEFLPQLQKNVGYTSSLLENLLQWSKSQLQNAVTRPVPLDLSGLSKSMLDGFQDRAGEKGITLINEIDQPTVVVADRDMIEAVYRNLLSNAIKFCSSGDRIKVSSKVEEGYTTVCVSDTGVGISEPDMDRLFKADTFTRRGTMDEQGTGLGLLLAKDFVEKNEGKIWVESELNQGSTFYFTLPNGRHTNS